MPETNQIVGKASWTSLDSKIEDLKPGWDCPAHTRNNFQKQFDKGQKPQDIRNKILKKVYLNFRVIQD